MNASVSPQSLSRRDFLQGAALVVGFSFAGLSAAQAVDGASTHTLDLSELDAFLAVRKDGSVVIYSGKVDLGTGHRIAIRQMVAEELSMAADDVRRIELIEGDTALTPDQGPTAGSTGVMRGGVQLRQAAATAREALLALAAARLQRPAAELTLAEGRIGAASGGPGISIAELAGERAFNVKLNLKAPLKDPQRYTIVGRSLPRPDLPAKATGRHVFVHDFTLPNMLHGRVLRPAAVGAKLLEVDAASIKHIPTARVIRIENFLGVVAEHEWAAVRAARELKARWSAGTGLVGHEGVAGWAKRGPFAKEEVLLSKGNTAALANPAGNAPALRATYFWPVQSHASMGPSCAVADVQAERATIWSASQATHRYQPALARVLGLPRDKLRVIYLDGAGCYGMNGHDDAAADAALLSKAIGSPVRVQWTRADELGWDPKGPPQLLELRAALDEGNRIAAWEAEMWVPLATANLAHVPLLGPADAGIAQPAGQSVGLISQNADPSTPVANIKVVAHWLADAPLRPSNIRAPGKVANCFAVESFIDQLAAAARMDPLAFRLRDLTDPRGVEVLKRCAALTGWTPRPSPAARESSGKARGRGIAYIHYKHSETYVAVAMRIEVDRASGAIRVLQIACAHDCGLMINPDAVRNQVEGNLLQALSRTLHERTTFDTQRVTSVDWSSYPILRFSDVPELRIDLIQRRDQPPLGAGEAASTPVPAALANAVFDATGARLYEVPFAPERVRAAMLGLRNDPDRLA